MTALLDRECELRAFGGGAYERELGQVWWGWEAQHGGYVLGLAMTALEAELGSSGSPGGDDRAGGEDMELHQLTLQYLKPFVDGPFRAEVTLERRGRTMANATVRMWSGGRLAGVAVGAFARRRPVVEFARAPMPDVAPFEPDGPDTDPVFPVPTFERVRFQARVQDLAGSGPGQVGGWVAPRTPELVDHRWLGVLVDLWPPVAYSIWEGGAVAQSVDLTYHARASLPRADLPPGTALFVRLTTRASAGGFVDEDVEVWSPSGELLAQSRQCRFIHGEA